MSQGQLQGGERLFELLVQGVLGPYPDDRFARQVGRSDRCPGRQGVVARQDADAGNRHDPDLDVLADGWRLDDTDVDLLALGPERDLHAAPHLDIDLDVRPFGDETGHRPGQQGNRRRAMGGDADLSDAAFPDIEDPPLDPFDRDQAALDLLV